MFSVPITVFGFLAMFRLFIRRHSYAISSLIRRPGYYDFLLFSFAFSLDTMSGLRYIIDIDGFNVHDNPRTNYLVKELAVFNLDTNSATLYRFRVHRTFNRLQKKDQQTARYCLHNVHGMRFRDYRNDLHQKYVDVLLSAIVDHCNFHNFTLGHKGEAQ